MALFCLHLCLEVKMVAAAGEWSRTGSGCLSRQIDVWREASTDGDDGDDGDVFPC